MKWIVVNVHLCFDCNIPNYTCITWFVCLPFYTINSMLFDLIRVVCQIQHVPWKTNIILLWNIAYFSSCTWTVWKMCDVYLPNFIVTCLAVMRYPPLPPDCAGHCAVLVPMKWAWHPETRVLHSDLTTLCW